MTRFPVECCVIDELLEPHATRAFAGRNRGWVLMNFFIEHERGSTNWDHGDRIVQVKDTKALDASRTAVREEKITHFRRQAIIEEFAAKHLKELQA